MSSSEIRDIIISLLINGFHLDSIKRDVKDCLNVNAIKYDKLGAKIHYSFLFSKGSINKIVARSFLDNSKVNKYTPVFISDHEKTDKCISFNFSDFFEKVGGLINTGLILVENINEIINKLGYNELPDGLSGKPDDLLEIYFKEIMQFLLLSPAKRYGGDRRFESLPDGIIIGKDLVIQFDTKAYTNGFDFKSDDIERFSKYVTAFNTSYSKILGSVYAFVVVSGKFNDSIDSIENRRKALYKKCQTNLSCLTCKDLGDILNIIKENPHHREIIDWRSIFSNTIITSDLVQNEIKNINKDKLV